MLLAISSAELVFNGELIIDRDFTTNDPYILAAGPGTRYKSCYYSDDYKHKYYNSSEVGREVLYYNKIPIIKCLYNFFFLLTCAFFEFNH